MSDQATRTRSGPGRLLIAVYAIFALSASARSAVQLGTHFSKAPLAYLLSAFAAAVYIVATICLTRGNQTSRRIATISILVELAGVLAVGTLSLLVPHLFPDATVWSDYGQGYGYIPAVLPVLGLWWLHTTRQRHAEPFPTS
jgi:amino acid transporter